VAVTLPSHDRLSPAALAIEATGMVRFLRGEDYLLELSFPTDEPAAFDLRPALPLVLRGERGNLA
jgi:hypothetical protein